MLMESRAAGRIAVLALSATVALWEHATVNGLDTPSILVTGVVLMLAGPTIAFGGRGWKRRGGGAALFLYGIYLVLLALPPLW